MEVDFVTYKIAVKLKEKGFPQVKANTLAMYNEVDEWFSLATNLDKDEYSFEDFDNRDCVCPTIEQALKWLREEKNIDIEIHASVDLVGIKVYLPYISTYTEFRFHDSDDVVRYEQKKFNPTSRLPHEIIPAHAHFYKWEEAAIPAIEYVLDNNLI